MSAAGVACGLWCSNLPFRQPQDEAVELGCQLDLAGQAAVRQPFGRRAVEQRILLVAPWRPPGEPTLVVIDMAGRAHGVAPAFGTDAIKAMPGCGQHGAFTVAGVYAFRLFVGMNEGDRRHLASVRL